MRKTAIMAAVLLGLAAPVHAQNSDQTVVQLKPADVADLSKGKAYIFYETVERKYDIFFLRSMTDNELVLYSTNRATALAEARAKVRADREGAPGVSDEDLIPDSSFYYADKNILNLVRLDSGRVYERDGERRTYVVEVPPGEYTIFGAGIDGFTSGTCMCMGSLRFDVAAGEIADLGDILVAPENGSTDIEELRSFEAPEYIRRKALPYIMSVRPAQQGDPVPQLLAGMDITHVQYRAADKMPNFLGMLINRMPALDGILAYDGDKVVDVRAVDDAGKGDMSAS